ncbi:hypothetical protein GCM10009609_48610 [Pseudonocardia aurantiaca]|uniref:CoA transferase n=1 Tax=Pseudonocardia aurantiaca TaxID=75290 RepID=A0ABW4FZ55_9PSEU
MLGRPDLESDARFAVNADRMRHRDELTAELESALTKRQSDELVASLLDAGVPAAPIQDYRQACDDPHTTARGMVVTMEHPVEGKVIGLGIPVKMSATPGAIRRAAPMLGQHTDEVLAEAGFSAEQSSSLRSSGAVA